MIRIDTYNRALGGSITPRLVVTGEDAKVASTHEFLVVHAQNGVVAVQEVGVEHNFDTIIRVIEELHAADLVQNGVVMVIRHVVRRDGGKGVPLEREDSAL